jgi:hypothetical protein
MIWVPYMHLDAPPTVQLIARRMGIAAYHGNVFKDPFTGESSIASLKKNTLDQPMKDFCSSLFRKKKELQRIVFQLLNCTPMDQGRPVRYRHISAVRRSADAPLSDPEVTFVDQLDFKVVKATCAEVIAMYTERFEPPPAHEPGLEMWRRIFRLRAMGRTGAGVEVTYPEDGHRVILLS